VTGKFRSLQRGSLADPVVDLTCEGIHPGDLMKKILITGATGQIGSELTSALRKK